VATLARLVNSTFSKCVTVACQNSIPLRIIIQNPKLCCLISSIPLVLANHSGYSGCVCKQQNQQACHSSISE